MGFYLRKSFRAGPVRLNLSKSGFGVSGGVKGARVGIGPRGAYVHAGREGLYYRKNLSSGRKQAHSAQTAESADGCAMTAIVVIAIILAAVVLVWLLQNPVLLLAGVIASGVYLGYRWHTAAKKRHALVAYKGALDDIFVRQVSPPTRDALAELQELQGKLVQLKAGGRALNEIELNVYQALLDRILDDGVISDREREILAAENVLLLNPAARLATKMEIFASAYLEAIEDRAITKAELERLKNLVKGLGIPQDEIRSQLSVVREIIEAQSLRFPLEPLPKNSEQVQTQKNEDIYYQCPAQVLSQRRSKDSATGFEYTLRRTGILVLTNKRILIEGGGTTTLRYSDIADVDVNIDDGLVEITKHGSGRATFLRLEKPIYAGRIIDQLTASAT